jgi:RHS repeat-associated protein
MYVVGSTKYYVHQNHLFSVSAVTDAAGSTRERYSYTGYGDRAVRTPAGAPLAKSQVINGIGFTGYVINAETNQYHARARQFNANHGRFTGRDPLQYINGQSLYRAYFAPNALDPSGTELLDWLDNFKHGGCDCDESKSCSANLDCFGKSALETITRGLLDFRPKWQEKNNTRRGAKAWNQHVKAYQYSLNQVSNCLKIIEKQNLAGECECCDPDMSRLRDVEQRLRDAEPKEVPVPPFQMPPAAPDKPMGMGEEYWNKFSHPVNMGIFAAGVTGATLGGGALLFGSAATATTVTVSAAGSGEALKAAAAVAITVGCANE